jgi:lia operon protein LiaI
MKTFLLICLGVIAGITVLVNIGPMIMLAISIAIAYYGVRKFILADATSSKVLWAIVILIGASISLSNIPALIGVVAFVVLYYTYKKWKQEKTNATYTNLNWDKL